MGTLCELCLKTPSKYYNECWRSYICESCYEPHRKCDYTGCIAED